MGIGEGIIMKIKIGSTLYLGEESDYHLSAPLQGLAAPAIRVGDGLYAGRDGGFVSGHFYGHRTLVFQGFYIGANCQEAAELRETLFSLLRIRYLQPIVIFTENGNYYTEGVISDVKADLDSIVSGKYQITILCPDPILYLLDENGTTSAHTWTSDTLVVGSSTQIGNSGSVDDYPVITCTGIFDNIELINETTQKKLSLDLETTQSTDVVLFNFPKRIITLNGDLANSYRTVDSSWWSLIPGINEILVSTDSGTPTLTIQHRKGRAGI